MTQSNILQMPISKQRVNSDTGTSDSTHLSVSGLYLETDKKKILNDVHIDIHHHKITAIIGPSGCGKSSFLACLNQLCRETAAFKAKGHINYNGKNILDDQIDLITLRRSIGMIFQQPNPFPISIRNNLDLPLREHGIKDKKLRMTKIQRSLESVGLWDEVKNRLDSEALSLSGGQQQRLCIARAIVLEPEILLMDEPCSALDPLSSALVEDLILSLRDRYTVVIVTHNLAQAKRISDYVGFFWLLKGAGTLIEFSHAEQLFNKPTHELTKSYISGARG